MPEIEAFMIEAALYHGFSEDSDNEDGVTDYRCSRAVLLKLMRACVKQGETNVRAQDEVRTVHIKLDKIIEQTKPKSFEIEIGPSLPPPSDLGMGYGASAALNQRVTELHKELYRVLDDKRKMYEPPMDAELSRCCEIFGPIKSVQTGPELQIAVRNVLKEIIAMRKCSTTYDNRPKPEKIAEPIEAEIESVRKIVGNDLGHTYSSSGRFNDVVRLAVTRFVELRNKD